MRPALACCTGMLAIVAGEAVRRRYHRIVVNEACRAPGREAAVARQAVVGRLEVGIDVLAVGRCMLAVVAINAGVGRCRCPVVELCRCPASGRVAIVARVGGREVAIAFALGAIAVMAGRAGRTVGAGMVERDVSPSGGDMAVVACITGGRMIAGLAERCAVIAIVAAEARSLRLGMIERTLRRPVHGCVASAAIVGGLEMRRLLAFGRRMLAIMAGKTRCAEDNRVVMVELAAGPGRISRMAVLAFIRCRKVGRE